MSCRGCHSDNQRTFNAELALHFPGLAGLNKPIVWVFPKISVCLDCGFSEFEIPERELGLLATGKSSESQLGPPTDCAQAV